MARHRIEAASASDLGKVRQYNEDSIALDPENGVVALADGMGGHRAGEVASAMATEIALAALRRQLPEFRSGGNQHSPLLAVKESINQANLAIWRAAQASAAHQGMGTTLAVALLLGDKIVFGHVGDSRIYRLRDHRLRLLTRDDSLLRDQVDTGLISAADASESHNRSLVTQALGAAESVLVHAHQEDSAPGDLLLLCSDGLNDMVEDSDIELIVDALQANLPLAAQHLVNAAMDNGGYDNISVVLARSRPAFAAGQAWLARWSHWLRRAGRAK